MQNLSIEASAKKHAQEVRARLYGKPQKPKPLLISVEKLKRPDMDQSYHMVLYRKYLLRLEKAQQAIGNKVIYANFSISPSAEYTQAAQILDFSYSEPEPIKRTMMQITMEVLAKYPDVSLEQIRSTRRFESIVEPRHQCWYAVYKERGDLSLVVIAKFFNREHTGLLHGIKCMKARLEDDKEAQEWIARKRECGYRKTLAYKMLPPRRR